MNSQVNSALTRALDSAEGLVVKAQENAALSLSYVFRAQLAQHNLKRHKVQIVNRHGLICLHVNGEPWFSRDLRHSSFFPPVKLLNAIDDILEKCDNGITKHLCGITL